MVLFDLLQSVVVPPASLGYVAISATSIIAALSAVYKAGQLTGQFNEFKNNVEGKIRDHQQMVDGVVYEKELDSMTKHIDYRFNELAKRLEELTDEISKLRDR